MCDGNREIPNEDFTSCIGEMFFAGFSGSINIHCYLNLDREPDVRIDIRLGQRNAYTMQESTYQVGYGHEFGLECRTSPFFTVQWKFNNQPCKSNLIQAT